ncbi:MAG TPA: energy transducer TonB [Polyangiaceae bacterium]|nr:energy transducer TonB [Polyangiaceae bacterium]
MKSRSALLPRPPLVGAGSIVASLLVHGVLVAAGALLVSVGWTKPDLLAMDRARAFDVKVEPIALPALQLGSTNQDAVGSPSEALPMVPGGGEPLARPDVTRRGRGGSDRADSPALNLSDRDEGLTLSRDVTSRLDREQIQRLATSRERQSYEDRRSTTHPMELVFLASGLGRLEERRPVAALNPNRGALRADAPSVLGSLPGAAPAEPGAPESPHASGSGGGALAGREHPSPGLGVLASSPGPDHRRSAAVALGRPLVTKAAPSVPAEHAGRPADTVDSEQEVASAIQSLVHASTAGGRPTGGPGGQDGPGPAGSDGSDGPGSRARPFGGGAGPFTGLSDSDPRISGYQRGVLAKIYPLWENAFPKSAALEGKQGRAIIALQIYADGHVADVKVARPSGFPEFDENVRMAVLRAAPFAPFPSNLPASSMRWSITFDANNPVVR